MSLKLLFVCLGFKKKKVVMLKLLPVAPRVGLEPTTYRLTAERSTNWANGEYKFGDYLSSQQGNSQVFSTLTRLTSVFGMGTGVSVLLSSPRIELYNIFLKNSILFMHFFENFSFLLKFVLYYSIIHFKCCFRSSVGRALPW